MYLLETKSWCLFLDFWRRILIPEQSSEFETRDWCLGRCFPRSYLSPLYSYLLSLVMGSDPLVSYQSAILLNVAVSQLLILLSIFLSKQSVCLDKNKKAGWLYVGLLYLVMATNTMITGFYFVAMSETSIHHWLSWFFVGCVSLMYTLKTKQAWLLAGTIGCTHQWVGDFDKNNRRCIFASSADEPTVFVRPKTRLVADIADRCCDRSHGHWFAQVVYHLGNEPSGSWWL